MILSSQNFLRSTSKSGTQNRQDSHLGRDRFLLSAKMYPDAHTLISVEPNGDSYTLTLDDGRSRKILVRSVNREPKRREANQGVS